MTIVICTKDKNCPEAGGVSTMENGNGIFVLMDFFTETAAVLPMSYDVFGALVKRINIDTSQTNGYCFCQKDDDYLIQTMDFKTASETVEKYNYPEYILAAWGDVVVTITLTNDEVIEFTTHFDRFWLDTDHETLKVVRYDEIVRNKVGLK